MKALPHSGVVLAILAGMTLVTDRASAQRVYKIVSVGDSVASGEGNPDVPQSVAANPGFNPIEHEPNPHYNPLERIPNPNYDPRENLINTDYNPIQRVINPDYQPFPIPPILQPLLPDFPPYDPTLTMPNPDYDPNRTMPNPGYDPNPLVDNPDYDPNLFTDVPNPGFDDAPYVVLAPAQWAKEEDHRSNLAGPALAAAELERRHPELAIDFLHRAKSGANIATITTQIDAALAEARGRIDVLMISAGGNDVGEGGFGKLIYSCIDALKGGELCSQNVALNEAITQSFAEMPGKFDDLAEHLARCDIGAVFITEYFDLTRGADGEFCADLDSPIPGASLQEMQWAYEHIVVPLNQTVEDAAMRHGWHYVGGIAAQFREHGYCASRVADPRPKIRNPNYDPRMTVPNLDYNPFQNLPNPNYNPVEEIPNLDYNPVQNKPNPNYDPRLTIANPDYQPNPFQPNYDPRLTISNPDRDTRLTVPNPDYDPNLTKPNPDYDPNPTVPNPDYNPDLTKPNPDYDPDLIIDNPDYEPGVVIGENWVVRIQESLILQGDEDGTAHPNGQGQAIYRDALADAIDFVGLETLRLCPRIRNISMVGPALRLQFDSEYPIEQLDIQTTTDPSNPDSWSVVPSTLTPLGSQFFQADLDLPPGPAAFVRVAAR